MAWYDFTGKCPKCGSGDLWDDQTAYGCNGYGWCNLLEPNPPKPKDSPCGLEEDR